MKQLLDGQYAPITYCWGFLEMPFDDVVAAYDEWNLRMARHGMSWHLFESTLADALRKLEPFLPTPILIAQTASNWTALFLGSSDGPDGHISYLAWQHKCRGVVVDCVNDTYDQNCQCGVPGGVQFSYCEGPATDTIEVVKRNISVTNQCESGWEWHEHGTRLSFENPDYYKARRIRDRLTDEILEEYCAALGINLFNDEFYGPHFGILRDSRPLPTSVKQENYKTLQTRIMGR